MLHSLCSNGLYFKWENRRMSLSEIENLIDKNEHVSAIKKYKEYTKCSLSVATSDVEYFQDHGSWPSKEQEPQHSYELTEVEKLVQVNKTINAIKLYRKITGRNLSQSKMEVEHFRDTNEWTFFVDGGSSEFKDGDSVSAQYFLDKKREFQEWPKVSMAFKVSMVFFVLIMIALILSSIYLFLLKN